MGGDLGPRPSAFCSLGRRPRCLLPLLSTTFQRLPAFVPPLPPSPADENAPDARPGLNASTRATQLSSELVVQVVVEVVVGAVAAPNTPCARWFEP